ncbi:MAG: hypothetical protein ACXVEF_13545 [Polyangiales bacterium]
MSGDDSNATDVRGELRILVPPATASRSEGLVTAIVFEDEVSRIEHEGGVVRVRLPSGILLPISIGDAIVVHHEWFVRGIHPTTNASVCTAEGELLLAQIESDDSVATGFDVEVAGLEVKVTRRGRHASLSSHLWRRLVVDEERWLLSGLARPLGTGPLPPDAHEWHHLSIVREA